MYFQKMKTHVHSLEQGRDASIKNRAHLPLGDLGLILYKVIVLPLFRYAYALTNLSITPHGSEAMLNKHQVETVLSGSTISHHTVHYCGHSGEIDLTMRFDLVVIYSAS